VIAGGPVTQICWVTDDLEVTERLLSDQFGVGAWTRIAGLHHVCFDVDDLDGACAAAEAAGVPVLMRGSMTDGEIEFAYVDGSAAGTPYVELARVGPRMREFYAAAKEGSR
jgi:catechol 2,3-dioxygenase-like lactoylglutathione lyase family enzyme